MPSFDIVSEVDKQEIDNAINQARKELSTRFDFKDSKATVEMADPALIELTAEDAGKLRSLMEIVIGRLAKRNIDLRRFHHSDTRARKFKLSKAWRAIRPRRLSKRLKRWTPRSRAKFKNVRSG
jgi:uncharacterized protein YajQ (UPF0234 family)